MERREVIRTLERYSGCSFITRKQVAQFMGYKDAHSVDPMLVGIDRVGKGLMFIPDVADRIMGGIRHD